MSAVSSRPSFPPPPPFIIGQDYNWSDKRSAKALLLKLTFIEDCTFGIISLFDLGKSVPQIQFKTVASGLEMNINEHVQSLLPSAE